MIEDSPTWARAHQHLRERGVAALYLSILPHFNLLRQAHPHYQLLFFFLF
jgi:hypothetical protein